MGNSLALIQKIRGIPAVPTESGDESDDDDEHWEVEYVSVGSVKCNNDHSKFIPVENLIAGVCGDDSLSMLPEDIRHESVLEYIRIHEKLVVRIVTGAQGDKIKTKSFGTGCATITTTGPEEFNCPLVNCNHNGGQAHKCYGGLLVYTNNHVIKDNLHAQSCNVDFFYYNDNSSPSDAQITETNGDRSDDCNNSLPPVNEAKVLGLGGKDINDNGNTNNISEGLHKDVTAYGNSLRENKQHKDLVGLRILYHDPDLHTIVKRYSELTSGAWAKIPEKIKSNLKKRVIIISHPHGWPKQVSFGDLICLEENDKKEKYRKVTRYNALTCQGSSGAPVLTGHYPYRPFVHSTKGKFGASFSY